MGRYAVGLLVCLLALATTFCRSDRATSHNPDGQDVANDANIDVAFDLSVPDFLPTDAPSDNNADTPSDTNTDTAQTDSDPSLQVDFDLPVTHCERTGFYGGELNVTVSWTTTLATICEMAVSIAI